MIKADREAFLYSILLALDVRDDNVMHRRFNNRNQEIPYSIGLNIKSILIASLVIAIALFVLIGSIILIPVVLIASLGYLVFIWCRSSIK